MRGSIPFRAWRVGARLAGPFRWGTTPAPVDFLSVRPGLRCDSSRRCRLERAPGTEDGQLKAAAFGTRSFIPGRKAQDPGLPGGCDIVTEVIFDPALQQKALASLVNGILDDEDVPIVEFGRLTEPTFQSLLRSLSMQGLRSTWNPGGVWLRLGCHHRS